MAITHFIATGTSQENLDCTEANAFIQSLRMAAQAQPAPQEMDADQQSTVRMRDPYFSFELI